ncbi:alpha/beta hydrolase fold domain-containing protein [Actinoplanes sp. CA-142083]|uniref:alpha/beta hydrolase fold domain-containing protein n=1 Tax=Actinoplanes sp. CA-142083 TaxID=3239903 RepID=UPI003D8DE3A8
MTLSPPPFDAELGAALAAIRAVRPAHPNLADMRRPVPGREPPTLEALARDGAFRLREDGDLLYCIPAGLTEPAPALYFIHGGGMVAGNPRTDMPLVLDWALELGMVAVSVDYRLAPEHPHPIPVEDCYRGLLRAAEASEIDESRIVVGGVSAGGGLAAAVALLARDRGGPSLAGQMLICPMLDDRNDSVSARQMAGLGVWDREFNEFGWTALLGDARGGPDVSPYAAPARASDLSGLAPAYVDVGSAETFRDEDVAYASRIWACGGQAELHVWPGGFHGFDGMVPDAALSVLARRSRLSWLRRVNSLPG